MSASPPARWQIWIDRGGTFTDCVGRDPTGRLHVTKVLSSDEAPLVGIRALLGLAVDAPIPPCDVRMGTTLATNALLERRGAPTALAITRGLADLLAIGDQTRPALFALDIVRPAPLPIATVELDARLGPDGAVIETPDRAATIAALTDAYDRGATSCAIAVIHGYRDPAFEASIAALARDAGFAHVTCSTEVADEQGLLARAETAVVDAYLTPLLTAYLAQLTRALPGSQLLMMQSSGGLVPAARFRGRDALVSGPAGGAVAVAATLRRHGGGPGIGFDMGGTSTDVAYVDGDPELRYEAEVAGARVRAPMLAVHTVAAGGGSLCRWDGLRLSVGPASAGAFPGPLAYGRPEAREPTITDVDLILGRLAGDRFPFPLERARAEAALAAIGDDLPEDHLAPAIRAAAGLFAIANATMAEAVCQVSIGRGRDPRDAALIVFGGAGGIHAAPVARALGITRVIVPPLAGVLSAWGMGQAPITWHDQRDAGRVALDERAMRSVHAAWTELVARGATALADKGALVFRRRIALRYAGSDAAITIDADDHDDVAALTARFVAAHRARFGFARDAALEVDVVRVEVAAPAVIEPLAPPNAIAAPAPRRHAPMWTGEAMALVPVYDRDDLASGATITGPALVLDATSTLALDAGWQLEVAADGALIARDLGAATAVAPTRAATDPILLEVHGNRFMAIAEQMGEALRRTAVSTNIRERRDFSCAIFDARGGLVANAPHIPVHLGAMGETIRALLAEHPHPSPGTVFASNDPAAGGSHLPDITVVTPVHDERGAVAFFTACRGHHADIGGLTPGSMPPFSTALADEGCVLHHLPIVRDDRFDEPAIRAALASGRHPARRPDDNVADLAAQVAANRLGAELVTAAARQHPELLAYMGHVQAHATALVARAIAAIPDGDYRFADRLDDGAVIAVALAIRGDALTVDFTGTAGAHPGNLNAPRAIAVAAVLYVLRALVGAPIPLNAGCLAPVTLVIPPGSLLDPPPGAAVCGGNVETSQRVVDVLLGALGLAAASQGTMNNLTFGPITGDGAAYYETICGGAGATPHGAGASAVHTHMTNTRITDPEVLEARFPVTLRRFAIRRGSGGTGARRGGDGVIRELALRAPLRVSIVSQRRTTQPFGLAGGGPGASGSNSLDGAPLAGAVTVDAPAGAILRIETPGGGGHGAVS
ncbi:MAG: hydantoinase B/oxoprolinase family protein [Deltaproteobacteria bacterium]|nr:hydantoinase B/oxoprolinase family protein [Deltaproteobacteria bacterium]